MKMGAGRGAERARSKVRERKKGDLEAVWRACRGGGARIGRRWTAYAREASGLAQRHAAPLGPPLTHSSHDAH